MPGVVAGAIGLLAFGTGASLAVVNAITFGTLIATKIAIGVGLSLAGGAINKLLTPSVDTSAGFPKLPNLKPADVQHEVRLEVAPRARLMGTTRTAGIRFWAGTDGQKLDSLWIGWIINHGRIEDILEHWLDDVQVFLSSNEIVWPPKFQDNGDEVHYIYFHLGTDPESDYTNLDSIFGTEDMRGDGLASVLINLDNHESPDDQLDVFPNGIPEYRQTNTGSVVYDAREAGHNRNNESTWEASENPVVHLFHYLFIDDDGYGISYARVQDNLDEWTAAMDKCDEAVALSSGDSESRYRIAGRYHLTDDPLDIAQKIMRTCDAKIWPKRDGQIGISVGEYIEPRVVIRDAHIVEYEVTRGAELIDYPYGVRAQYMSPSHGYVQQEADPWPGAVVARNQDGERADTLDLTWVPSHTQARRLMKRHYIRRTAEWRLTLITTLAGLRAVDERFITVQIAELDLDESFEIVGFELDTSSMTIQMQLISVDSTIDDWDTSEEGTEPEANPLQSQELDPTSLTKIGNMTAGGGLAAAFDRDIDQTGAAGAGTATPLTDAWVGVSLASSSRIKRAIVYASNDQGFINASATTVNIQLFAKVNTAPLNGSNGTQLGATASFTDAVETGNGIEIISDDLSSEWDHVWVRITDSVSEVNYCAEVRFFT